MKIRSKIELKDSLDKDFAWRKPELTQILSSVNSTKGRAQNVAIRSAILLLYAHWEGFVKHSATVYLNFIKNQDLKYKNLKNCFVALSLKQKIESFEQSNKATVHTQLIDYIQTFGEDKAMIDDSNVITTGSNLKSTILKELLTTIGIDYTPFDLKANLIDEQLLKHRNTIAHGEHLQVDEKEYKSLHREIFGLMTIIKNEIENAVVLGTYRIP